MMHCIIQQESLKTKRLITYKQKLRQEKINFTHTSAADTEFCGSSQRRGKFMKGQIVIHLTAARNYKGNPYGFLGKLCS